MTFCKPGILFKMNSFRGIFQGFGLDFKHIVVKNLEHTFSNRAFDGYVWVRTQDSCQITSSSGQSYPGESKALIVICKQNLLTLGCYP